MRLVDAEALKKEMETAWMYAVDMYTACSVIDNAPTVDAKPVERGRWEDRVVRGSTTPYCTNCGNGNDTIYHYDFCPNCGADMRVEEERRIEGN